MAQSNNTTSNNATDKEDVPTKLVGDTVTADTYLQMIDVLESLASHNHIFYDDYTTVCECQCQCACSRGTL